MYTLPEEYSRHAAQTTDAGWYRVWSGPETVTARKTCTQKGDRRKRSHRTSLRIKIQIHNTFEKERERKIGVPGWQIRGPRPELLHISYMEHFDVVSPSETHRVLSCERQIRLTLGCTVPPNICECVKTFERSRKKSTGNLQLGFFLLSLSLSVICCFPETLMLLMGPRTAKLFRLVLQKQLLDSYQSQLWDLPSSGSSGCTKRLFIPRRKVKFGETGRLWQWNRSVVFAAWWVAVFAFMCVDFHMRQCASPSARVWVIGLIFPFMRL